MKIASLPAVTLITALSLGLCAAVPDNGNQQKSGSKNGTHPVLAKPINLVVNTKADEDDPHSAGNALYYSSNAGGARRIMMTTRANPASRWGKGAPVANNFDTEEDRSAYFVAERLGFQYLFFATVRDKEAKNFDIFAVQRLDTRKSWSALTAVQAVCTEADEMHPWVSADRKTMYFSRRTRDGWRIFFVTRPTANGPQFPGEPKVIEELPTGFHHATLTPDGKTMYLQGPLEKGRWGLFVASKIDGKWSQPVPLDLLNSPDAPTGDRSPCLTPDGAALYFASDRTGGQGGLDLWVVPTAQKLRSK